MTEKKFMTEKEFFDWLDTCPTDNLSITKMDAGYADVVFGVEWDFERGEEEE